MTAEHDLDTRRRRLRFRTSHTGTRETDILLGGFVDARVDGLDEPRIGELERLLACNDDRDILDWITERAPMPREFATPVMSALIAYVRDRHRT